jgi:trigger factor
MTVSVEALSGLERKVTVSVPTAAIEDAVSARLLNLVHRVKIHGFRPGKAPMQVVKQRYADGVRDEVARELVQSSLYEALQQHALVPAGTPHIEPGQLVAGEDFIYTAHFEIFPEVHVNELRQTELEIAEASVVDADVDALLEKLREQNKTWSEVTRAAVMGDRLTIDFEGFIDELPLDNAREQGYEFVLGEGQMIEGFESGLVGAECNTPVVLNLTFPEAYHESKLAGKPVRFEIVVTKIEAGVLPELNDEFALKFNITEGGIDALKKDIKANMVRELERRLGSLNRETIFDALLAVNPFDVPAALVEREIANLKHEMYHRVFGHEHSDNEKIPDFPRVLFEAQARRRVHMGLLFSEYVKKHEMAVDPVRVDAMIDKHCAAYEDSEGMRAWYHEKPERMAEVEALVMEEQVAEKIVENVTLSKKKISYDEVMNPNKSIQAEDKEGN